MLKGACALVDAIIIKISGIERSTLSPVRAIDPKPVIRLLLSLAVLPTLHTECLISRL